MLILPIKIKQNITIYHYQITDYAPHPKTITH